MSIKANKKAKFDQPAGKVGIGLGGIFKGLGDFIELLGELAEKGEELKREGEIKIGKETKGVYGFTIRTGIGREPRVSSFGNIKRTPKGPVVEEEREPIIDVFDEKEYLLVTAELPGVSQENITTEVKGDVLIIKAADSDRKYNKEVVLSEKVDSSSLTTSYKNGILEIRIQKVKKGKD